MASRIAGVPLVLLALALARTVHAQPADVGEESDPEARWVRHFVLLAHGGIGAPVGLAGITAEVLPEPFFALGVGAGLGAEGTQYAGAARLRIPAGAIAPGVGLGASYGPYARFDPFSNPPPAQDVLWLNADASIDYAASDGNLYWRVYLGVATELNVEGTLDSIPYAGFAIGVSL